MSRRVFVGDVQGCLEPLRRLLEAVAFRPAHDELIATGDLVAKGPDSLGVLRLMCDLRAQSVVGNHDLSWLESGRVSDPALEGWLRGRPAILEFDDLIVVHAGLHPHWDDARLRHLSDADVNYAVNVRYCDADGNRPPSDWPPPPLPFRPWDEFCRLSRRVVFGHWARRGLDRTRQVIALDSGCVYGGPLSAWIAEEDRVVQVPGLRSRDD